MHNNMEYRTRIKQLAKKCTLICLCGLGYAFIVQKTGVSVPCPFRALTGLYCPGCGTTRLCMALLCGDWRGAWHANAMLLCLFPLLTAVAAAWAVRYVKTGERHLKRREETVLYLCCALLVLFCIFRNITK